MRWTRRFCTLRSSTLPVRRLNSGHLISGGGAFTAACFPGEELCAPSKSASGRRSEPVRLMNAGSGSVAVRRTAMGSSRSPLASHRRGHPGSHGSSLPAPSLTASGSCTAATTLPAAIRRICSWVPLPTTARTWWPRGAPAGPGAPVTRRSYAESGISVTRTSATPDGGIWLASRPVRLPGGSGSLTRRSAASSTAHTGTNMPHEYQVVLISGTQKTVPPRPGRSQDEGGRSLFSRPQGSARWPGSFTSSVRRPPERPAGRSG